MHVEEGASASILPIPLDTHTHTPQTDKASKSTDANTFCG